MVGNCRIIWEQFASTGVSPTVTVDTDDLSPPVYEDVTKKLIRQLVIAPGDTDTQVVLSDASCSFLLVSDAAVIVKLKSGETPLRLRSMTLNAEDSSGAALPAQTLLLTGNGTVAANVEIYALAQVT